MTTISLISIAKVRLFIDICKFLKRKVYTYYANSSKHLWDWSINSGWFFLCPHVMMMISISKNVKIIIIT